MTSQQRADILLRQHQANRASALGLSIVRSEMLKAFYDGEIAQGADALTANQRMHAHAAYLDGDYERDLDVLRQCMERIR
jgi:hypothetical protein